MDNYGYFYLCDTFTGECLSRLPVGMDIDKAASINEDYERNGREQKYIPSEKLTDFLKDYSPIDYSVVDVSTKTVIRDRVAKRPIDARRANDHWRHEGQSIRYLPTMFVKNTEYLEQK